ncbi:MAG: hypothetical protein D3924_05815 [Candidatus Electrothrix sp. AR4]|nr:hypothetical protein [Candidatus Electrothrix sp. AR4]
MLLLRLYCFLLVIFLVGCSSEGEDDALPMRNQQAESAQVVKKAVDAVKSDAECVGESSAPKINPTPDQVSQQKRRDCRSRKEEMPHNYHVKEQ